LQEKNMVVSPASTSRSDGQPMKSPGTVYPEQKETPGKWLSDHSQWKDNKLSLKIQKGAFTKPTASHIIEKKHRNHTTGCRCGFSLHGGIPVPQQCKM
jgi:hypothetical protein